MRKKGKGKRLDYEKEGHYQAVVKRQNMRWQCSDDLATKLDLEEVNNIFSGEFADKCSARTMVVYNPLVTQSKFHIKSLNLNPYLDYKPSIRNSNALCK